MGSIIPGWPGLENSSGTCCDAVENFSTIEHKFSIFSSNLTTLSSIFRARANERLVRELAQHKSEKGAHCTNKLRQCAPHWRESCMHKVMHIDERQQCGRVFPDYSFLKLTSKGRHVHTSNTL